MFVCLLVRLFVRSGMFACSRGCVFVRFLVCAIAWVIASLIVCGFDCSVVCSLVRFTCLFAISSLVGWSVGRFVVVVWLVG